MFKMDEETGDAEAQQGDSWSFKVTGIPDDYTVYYSVYEIDTREIIFEINTTPENEETTIEVTPVETDKLQVEDGKKYKKYGYGIKRCKDGFEDTVIIGNKQIGEINVLKIYPKITEGAINGQS